MLTGGLTLPQVRDSKLASHDFVPSSAKVVPSHPCTTTCRNFSALDTHAAYAPSQVEGECPTTSKHTGRIDLGMSFCGQHIAVGTDFHNHFMQTTGDAHQKRQ